MFLSQSTHAGARIDEAGALRLDPGHRADGAFKVCGTARAFAAACGNGQCAAMIALVFPAPAASRSPAQPPQAIVFTGKAVDDFTLIRGIDAATVATLESFGVTRFRDVAAFTPEDVTIVGQALGNPRRLSKEGWIEQAALLAAGTMTSFALLKLTAARPTPVILPLAVPASIAAVPAPLEPGSSTTADVVDISAVRRRSGRVRDAALRVAAAIVLCALAAAGTAGIDPMRLFAGERASPSACTPASSEACSQHTLLDF